MRTAIFVYQPTLIKISSNETDLQLCGMTAATVPLAAGDNASTLAPGAYKIVSSYEVLVTGDTAVFDVVISTTKDNDPTPPLRATEDLASLDASALQAFLSEPDAKTVVNP